MRQLAAHPFIPLIAPSARRTLPVQVAIVSELDSQVMRCVRDANGNHVIQKVIECVPTPRITHILDAFLACILPLSGHPFGCRIVQVRAALRIKGGAAEGEKGGEGRRGKASEGHRFGCRIVQVRAALRIKGGAAEKEKGEEGRRGKALRATHLAAASCRCALLRTCTARGMVEYAASRV
eukprot:354835-Chlamydomonas_euryale.AAC.1